MGGSAREWSAVLPADIVAGSQLRLRLTMISRDPETVTIAYQVRVD